MSQFITRRKLLESTLRGSIAGAGISLALPYLDVFLNTNGDALAATGAPLPRRFGTWFFGCGMNPDRWNPATEGTDFKLPPELLPIERVRQHISVLSGFSVLLAGETNHVHRTGVFGTMTGGAPITTTEIDGPTLDVLIADTIGDATRFRSLEMAAHGLSKDTYSQRNAGAPNPAEPSPLALYQRVFGTGFTDPNAGEFTPDPRTMLRKSVLSVVAEDRARLESQLGQADRARLDEYFTALRQLEKQLDLQLSEPPPLEACLPPAAPDSPPISQDIEHVAANHDLMAQLLALALACDQTRVFNLVFSAGASRLHKSGSSDTHHTLTHEEAKDAALGYQPQATEFVLRSMNSWARFVEVLGSVREGDGTLLDNSVVLCHSETSDANSHSVTGLPIMLAGTAGGRIKNGLHIRGSGESTARVGLTLQQVMGRKVARWGYRANETARPLSELLT